MNLKLVLTCLGSFFFVTAVYADGYRTDCSTGKKIEIVDSSAKLELAQDWYDQHTSLAGNFSQYSYQAALDIAETSSGKVWFDRSGRMRWLYDKPEVQDFLIKENVLWYYRPLDNQVLVDSFKSMVISELPIAFMLGLGNIQRDFSFVSGCMLKDSLRLVLEPRSAKDGGSGSGLKELVLVISQKGQPQAAEIRDLSGSVTTVEFSNVKIDQVIKPDVFMPKFPEGVDIMDRRIK